MAIQLLNKSYITVETWYVAYFLSTSGQEKTFLDCTSVKTDKILL